MKYTAFVLVSLAVFGAVFAEEKAEEEVVKVYKRLIPADVLRGIY